MKLVQDLIILAAKFLILIGDVVIMTAASFWKAISSLLNKSTRIKKTLAGKYSDFKNNLDLPWNKGPKETEIYSSETLTQRLNLPEIEFKKPELELPNFELPKLNLPKLEIPPFEFPRIPLPKIKLPKLKIPQIVFPKFSFPRINLPKIEFPKIIGPIVNVQKPTVPKVIIIKPALPRFNINLPRIQPAPPIFSIPRVSFTKFHRKKRGRRRMSFVPYSAKFKYLFIGALVSFIFIFLPLVFVIFIQNLPNPGELAHQDVAQTTKIYDRDGGLLYQIYANQNRTVVRLNRIPKNLQNATIAIEDKNFYTTPGFDLLAIIRSAYGNFTGKPVQGGSTITQQLVKARLLTPERSIQRKVKEIVLAVWAQRIYTKEQILEMYFNQVPYGGTTWGVEAAAQTYFGKDVKDLDLAQSAFLAGLPQAPSIYSPYGENPDSWKPRQIEVLKRMAELGLTDKNEAKKAEKEKLTFEPQQHILKAPHFVNYIKDILIEKLR